MKYTPTVCINVNNFVVICLTNCRLTLALLYQLLVLKTSRFKDPCGENQVFMFKCLCGVFNMLQVGELYI